MTVLAIVHPTDLVATDLREKLEARPDLWQELRLYALNKEEIGTLAESRGRPTLIAEIEEESFDKVDVAFLFGDMARLRPIVKAIPPRTTVVLLAPDATPEEAHPVVIGIDDRQLPEGQPLLSPHAAVIGLAHLLHPLARFRPQIAAATVFQPVSTLGKEALDELFEQTREVLNFERPAYRLLPRQLAFNVLGGGGAGAYLESQLSRVLAAPEISLSIEVLRTGIFHGFGISLHLRLEEDPGIEALRATLGEHPVIELADGDLVGTIDVAAREEVLVGAVERSGPGAYRIWALIDNLTRGGATNAFGILEALRSPVF
jgi:aspartate-semialdehyde dehydrogenase